MEYKQFITDVHIFSLFICLLCSCQLLHMIHKKLQYSADFKPTGLNLIPARLFDEKRQEIKNPLLLKNEQKIWVSYGKDYR